MTLKSLALAAATVTLLSGAALAQTDNMTTNATPPTGSTLEDKTMMAPFYSDESMATMKTGDEFTAAWNAMSGEDRDRVRADCENNMSLRAEFCQNIKSLQTQ